MDYQLQLKDLSIGYGQKVVGRGISASLKTGELVCLLGRNGIGKSTLLRTIASIQPPLAGEITLDGKSISDFDKKELARTIGIVLTERNVHLEMTVRELVSLGRSPYTGFFGNLSHEDRQIVEESLSMVGVSSLADRHIGSLSDGEQQKAMIAKALAQQTPVILLDEPTAFLDFQSRVELYGLLKRLAHEERKIILMTTHDLQLAVKLADKLWLMEEGSLSVYDTPLPDEVITQFVGIDIDKLV